VFCLHTGRLVSVELLARWVEDGRHVSPADFVALAEEVGLIRSLGVQMLDHAVTALRGWSGVPGLSQVSVAVNISPLHVVHGLLEDLAAALASGGVDPERLTLEITEQHALPDEDGTKEVLDAVSAMGIRVAIDDFGTGFSSIRWLTSLPLDLVKLDRSLLASLGSGSDGEENLDLLDSVGLLTRAMSRTAVAEGIETVADLARVRDAGIDLGQGYLLSRPMPLPELVARAATLPDHVERLLAASDAVARGPVTPDGPAG
jgi:EAL domain-containing protein (putative c-di-GMP-specific phosphodiesterase class I)